MSNKVTIFNRIETYGIIIVFILMALRGIFGPGLNSLMLYFTTLLAIFYLWLGFFIFTRTMPLDLLDPRRRAQFNPFIISSSIVMGVVYSYTFIAILFGFLFYSGMMFMLGSSFILVLVTTALLYFYDKQKPVPSWYMRQLYKRSILFGAISFILWVTPVDTRLEILFRDHPEFIEAYQHYRENPEDERAIERLREERSRFR